MLDIKFIRENPEIVKEAVKNKNIQINVDELLDLDRKRRGLLAEIDELRAEKNKLAREAKQGRPSAEAVARGKKIKREEAALEEKLKKVQDEFNELMRGLPNMYSEDTPVGAGESENKIIKRVGDIPKFDFQPKSHMELGILHNIIDTEKSAVISGARFNYLFGEAVMLQFALIQFTFHTLTDGKIIKKLADQTGNPFGKPFTPVIPPVIAKSEIMKKMDRFDPIEDRYYLEQDDSLLVGSAEHTLGPLHMNEVLDEKDLPIRYIGYSTAFRREAGAYGKDTAGILRRHQFDKAEMETFIQPEYGMAEQNLIVAIQEYLVRRLEIPYRLVLKCTGDMGKPDFRAIDIECWMPSQNKYRETHTSDYMTDFQARRLNIKYKNKKGEKILVHMNDATAFAIGRTIIAILENYQQEDGSVVIPEILRQYMPSKLKIISKINKKR